MDPDDNSAAGIVNTNDKPVAVAQEGRARQLLPHDVKELERVTSFATKKEKKMQNLSNDFDQMGKLRLIWDSKVPKKNRRFYYFFSLSCSNRKDVLKEIKKYREFYKEMNDVIRIVSNDDEKTDIEQVNPYTIILDLNEKLTKLADAATSGEKSTASSTVYELHREFIANHEKLENMIKRVECVALKDGLKKATDGWQESIHAIGNLRTDLQNTEAKYDQMCDRFDRLMEQNEQLLDQQKMLLENNHKMEQQQEILLQENAAVKSLLKSLVCKDKNKETAE